MGFFLAVGVPISLRFLHSNNRTFYTHFIFVFCAVIILISAIFLTGSRTAIVALLPSVLVVIYFSIYMYSIISKKMAFLISIASILPLFYFLPVEEIWIRISSIYSEVVNLSFGSRYVIWTEGFQVFANSPTIGVGYGGFRAAAEPILGYEVPPESTYLGALYQLGIIGAILFTLVLTSLFKMAKSNLLWLSFLITNLILMITNDWLHYPTMWILFAIMVVDLTLDNPVERTTKTQ
ncbi:O-antigen ligase family protein [Halosegnis longus]|uniref:O-antigen ligase family protein n=1 Tax=Halosegnis longus TaxID=2216012 RepID=UPI003742A4EA